MYGDTLDPEDVAMAFHEASEMSKQFAIGAVARDDVAECVDRYVAVANEHRVAAERREAAGIPPAYCHAGVGLPVLQVDVRALQAKVNMLRIEIYREGAQILQLQRETASIRRQTAFQFNAQVARQNRASLGVPFFLRLCKTRPGLGQGLPTAITDGIVLAHPLPKLRVGARVPTRFWPWNQRTLERWTAGDVDALSRVLNEDFGIVATDSIYGCRRKLFAFMLQLPAALAGS